MRSRLQSKSVFIIILLFFPAEGFAASIPGLAAYLEHEISSLENAVVQCPVEFEGKPEQMEQESKDVFESRRMESSDDLFLLKNLWVRIRPRVTFGLPGLTTIQIIPEVEMLWQRQNPTGWMLYEPPKKFLD